MDLTGAGLCDSCHWARRVVTSRGSAFVRCGKSDDDSAYPRYPRLPVLRCPAHTPEPPRGDIPN